MTFLRLLLEDGRRLTDVLVCKLKRPVSFEPNW